MRWRLKSAEWAAIRDSAARRGACRPGRSIHTSRSLRQEAAIRPRTSRDRRHRWCIKLSMNFKSLPRWSLQVLSKCQIHPAALPKISRVLSWDEAFLSLDRAFLSWDGAVLSLDRAFLSWDSAVLSLDKTFLSWDRAVLSLDRAFLSLDRAFLSLDRAFLSLDRAVPFFGQGCPFFGTERSFLWNRAVLSLEQSCPFFGQGGPFGATTLPSWIARFLPQG